MRTRLVTWQGRRRQECEMIEGRVAFESGGGGFIINVRNA